MGSIDDIDIVINIHGWLKNLMNSYYSTDPLLSWSINLYTLFTMFLLKSNYNYKYKLIYTFLRSIRKASIDKSYDLLVSNSLNTLSTYATDPALWITLNFNSLMLSANYSLNNVSSFFSSIFQAVDNIIAKVSSGAMFIDSSSWNYRNPSQSNCWGTLMFLMNVFMSSVRLSNKYIDSMNVYVTYSIIPQIYSIAPCGYTPYIPMHSSWGWVAL